MTDTPSDRPGSLQGRQHRCAPQAAVLATAILVALAPGSPASPGETHHVSSSLGDDAWSGKLPEPNARRTDGPRRSLEAASELVNAARPGDRVLLRAGDTWSGSERLVLWNAQGTEAEPVLLGRYGEGKKPRLELSGRGDIVTVRGGYEGATTHLIVAELVLTTSAPAGQRPNGILVSESYRPESPRHVTLRGLELVGLRMGLNLQADDLVVEGCTLRDNFAIEHEKGHSQGLYAKGDRIVIRENVFDNNGRPNSFFDWNTYLSQGRGYVFEGNVSRNAVGGIKLRRASDAVVRGNTFHGLDLVAISLGGDQDGGIENVVVERNLIYDTVDGITVKDQAGGGAEGVKNVVIRNNVLRHNRRGEAGTMGGGYPGYITVTRDSVDGLAIVNNLVWGVREKRGLYLNNPKVSGLRVLNNIFGRGDAKEALVEIVSAESFAGLALDHNLYHIAGGAPVVVERTRHADLDALRRAHPGLEAAGQEGDPRLADPPHDLGLTAASRLAVDRGADLGGLVEDDFEGRPRPQDGDGDGRAASDIGPYELVPTTGG